MERLNVAVIGCGSISQTHFDSIRDIQGASLYAVVDPDPDKVRKVSEKEKCLGYYDYRDLLNNEDIHVVHITTPHYRHRDIAVELARAGKHILLEKPLAETHEEAVALCENLRGLNIKSGIVYQNRFNPTVKLLKKLISQETYGRLLGVKGILTWNRELPYYRDSNWRGQISTEGGGVLINQGIHTIDILQWLGGDIRSVRGSASKHKFGEEVEVEDTSEIFMEFQSGARGIFFASNNYSCNSSVEIEAHCEEAILNIKNGRLRLYRDDCEEILLEDHRRSSVKDYYGNGHLDLIRNFYDSIRGKDGTVISLDEGLKALKIIDTIYQRGI